MAFALWHDGAGDGYDRCTIRPQRDGWRLEGTAILPQYGARAQAVYHLQTDADWRVRRLAVTFDRDGRSRQLDLRTDEPGTWRRDGRRQPALDGCLDAGLDFTPAGLTPMIRRLDLHAGQTATFEVVHVLLPDLRVEREEMALTHVEPILWRHTHAGRTWAVHVGPSGLVTEYEDAWTAVALG